LLEDKCPERMAIGVEKVIAIGIVKS